MAETLLPCRIHYLKVVSKLDQQSYRSRSLRWVAISVFVIGAAGSIAAQEDVHLETFDEAWRIISETHWDTEFNGVDWEAVREELRPLAAEARSVADLRGVIREMLNRLDQSHFALWPGDAIGNIRGSNGDVAGGGGGDPGFKVILVGDQFVVSLVDPKGPAAEVGVATGWTLRRVDSYEIGSDAVPKVEDVDEHTLRVEAQLAMRHRISGSPGNTIRFGFLDENNRPRRVEIEIARPAGELSLFGNLPPIFAALESEVLEPDSNIDIGVITFNIWLPVISRLFDEAIDQMRDADGIVLDLRGNPGGLGGMVMGIGGHFVDKNVSLGTMRTRESTLQFITNPRRIDTSGSLVEPYEGPLAILMDNTSASTSEVFAGGLQAIGRAHIFGQRSMGAVLPSLMDELPNGDVLQHAFADFVISKTGVRLEGRGVIPDGVVDVTRADLLEGNDPVLEAAIEWIKQHR